MIDCFWESQNGGVERNVEMTLRFLIYAPRYGWPCSLRWGRKSNLAEEIKISVLNMMFLDDFEMYIWVRGELCDEGVLGGPKYTAVVGKSSQWQSDFLEDRNIHRSESMLMFLGAPRFRSRVACSKGSLRSTYSYKKISELWRRMF